MFLLAMRAADDELQYWSGGESWSTYASEAVRFVREQDGAATIDVLKTALQISPIMRVVIAPPELEGP
jgi:hypothetical protein